MQIVLSISAIYSLCLCVICNGNSNQTPNSNGHPVITDNIKMQIVGKDNVSTLEGMRWQIGCQIQIIQRYSYITQNISFV